MLGYIFFYLICRESYACFFPLDPEYKRFLENYSCDEEKSMANPETLLGEIEAKTRELIGIFVCVFAPNSQTNGASCVQFIFFFLNCSVVGNPH